LFGFATRPAKDFHIRSAQHLFERQRNCAANQYIHPEVCNPPGPHRDFCIIQRVLCAREFAAIVEIDHDEPPGNVEHRRNSSVTDWDGNSHGVPPSNPRAGCKWTTAELGNVIAGKRLNISATIRAEHRSLQFAMTHGRSSLQNASM
jgi:hypothetical protein